MTAKLPNLQDQFLNAIRRTRTPVGVFVMKGVKLQGQIEEFDAFSLLLRREGSAQIVYKHAIATIMPARPVEGLPPELPPLSRHGSMQDRFLGAAAGQKTDVRLFLANGVLLEGDIAGFDQFSLLLRRGRTIQLIYKHAISTIDPVTAMDVGRDALAVPEDA